MRKENRKMLSPLSLFLTPHTKPKYFISVVFSATDHISVFGHLVTCF